MIVAYHLLRLLSVFPQTGRTMIGDILLTWPVAVVSLIVLTAVSSLFRAVVLPSVGFTWRADDTAYIIGLISTPLPNYLLMRWLLLPRRSNST